MLENPGGDELVAGSRTSLEFEEKVSKESGIELNPPLSETSLQALHNLFKLSR